MHESFISLAFVLIGFVGLIGGGELLVRASAALASAMRISPLVIGLTVVAFGTSAPELAVTVQSAWAGAAELAVGNVVGSNIVNILLVLGISALIAPLAVHSRIVRIDVPLMIAASLLLWLLAYNGRLGFLDGALLVGLLILYAAWSVWQGRREGAQVQQEFAASYEATRLGALGLLRELLTLLAGLILLAGGARLLVMGAVDLARVFGISELIIGLTIVAIGTSLPEVVTSVIASLRGQRDIAVGNVIGSNLFNILCVLGLGSLVAPRGIVVTPDALWLDLPIMIGVALVCLPICFSGMRISRLEGAGFLLFFGLYLGYLVLRALEHPWLAGFEQAMLWVVIPLALVAVLVAFVRPRSSAEQSAGAMSD